MKLTVQFKVKPSEEEAHAVAQAILTAITDGIQVNTPEGVVIEIEKAQAEVTQSFDLMADEPTLT